VPVGFLLGQEELQPAADLGVMIYRALGYEVAEEECGSRPDHWRLEHSAPRFRRLLRIAVQQEIMSVPSAAAMAGLSTDEVAELVAAPPTSAGQSPPTRGQLTSAIGHP